MVYFENLVFRFSQGLQIVEGVACSVHVTRQHVGKRKGLRRLLLKDRARLRLAIIGRIMMRLALLLHCYFWLPISGGYAIPYSGILYLIQGVFTSL